MSDLFEGIDLAAVERHLADPVHYEAFVEGVRRSFNGRNHPLFLGLCAGAALAVRLGVKNPQEAPTTGDPSLDQMAAEVHGYLVGQLQGKPVALIDGYLEAVRRELAEQASSTNTRGSH